MFVHSTVCRLHDAQLSNYDDIITWNVFLYGSDAVFSCIMLHLLIKNIKNEYIFAIQRKREGEDSLKSAFEKINLEI